MIMNDFWRLVSLLVSGAGFLITCGILLYRGESLLGSAVRAAIVFVLLSIVQNFFGSILTSVVKQETEAVEPPEQAQDAPGDS